jgi:selenocysteine-specific elongation factor
MKSVVIGTAGHIDHGKSALVRALTSIDPDRLKEEQERGITIDLGFAHWQADGINFAFVDVPGHERFVKNMLAGVGGFDAVLLVVAADESVMPQTREHFEICRLLRIPAGLVVLTKADLVDADTIELVRLEVRDLVAGSFLERAPIVPVSSRTGAGLDALRAALVSLGRDAQARPAAGTARLPIDRVFTMKGFGTVVTGTLVSGQIGLDDELEVLPQHRRVKVRGIQVHGARQERATAGQRVALNLGGVETSDLSRGHTLLTPGSLDVTTMLDAVVEVVAGGKPLRHGTRVRVHQGTSEVLGRVAIAGLVDEASSEARRPTSEVGTGHRTLDTGRRADGVGSGFSRTSSVEIPPGGRAYIRLRLESPAVVTRGDRYILRAYSPPMTIAGGEVLDPRPARGGIRNAEARQRFACLDPTAPVRPDDRGSADERALRVMIEEAGVAGLPAGAATSRAGLSPAAARAATDRLLHAGAIVQAGDRLVGGTRARALAGQLVKALEDYHREQPLSEGMPREEVRERLFGPAGPALFDLVVANLVASKQIVARDRLALAGHTLALTPAEEQAREAIERAFREGGLKPPDADALSAIAHGDRDLADRMVKLLVRQKVLAKVDTLVFHAEALRGLREDVAALKRQAPGARLDVGAFKDRYAITRKYAIPLLEYLDRERVTRRVGDVRVVI